MTNSERKYKYYKNKCAELENELFSLRSDAQIESRYNLNLHAADMANQCFQVFKWHKVPNVIPVRTIEMNLFAYGKIAYIRDDILGDFMLPFTYSKGVDCYGEYKYIRPVCISTAGELLNKEYEINKNCVVIRDNELEVPPIKYAVYYAKRIAELFRIRDKNNNWLKLPFIFSSTGDRGIDEKNMFEIQNIFGADNNEIAVVSSALEQLNFYDLKPQYFGLEIQEQIRALRNEFYMWCGLKHLPVEKKERMIVDEVNIEDEITDINVQKRYSCRERAVDEIKNLFGVSMEVEVNTFNYEKTNSHTAQASVSGGAHNDGVRNQQRTKRD